MDSACRQRCCWKRASNASTPAPEVSLRLGTLHRVPVAAEQWFLPSRKQSPCAAQERRITEASTASFPMRSHCGLSHGAMCARTRHGVFVGIGMPKRSRRAGCGNCDPAEHYSQSASNPEPVGPSECGR